MEVAKKVKREAAGPTAQRCSLAFGVMPDDDAPVIAITADAISYNGAQISKLPVLKDTRTIEPLYDRVKQKTAAAFAPSAPVVAIQGPGMIRPLPTTPMYVVNRVIGNIVSGGDDFLLAAQNATGWRLLRSLTTTLPVVPVPVGTGGSWNRSKSASGSLVVMDDVERVHLSVLVTKEQIWLGLSRVNEFQEIKLGTGTEWDALAKTLAAHKQSAFFVDRTDLEVAGDDLVPYSQVVRVIDAVTAAGFDSWVVKDPHALSATPTL